MRRRRISRGEVASIIASPQQSWPIRPDRWVLQSISRIGGRDGLIRVFIDLDRDPAEVVTVYRTSRVAKYWRYDA